MRGRRGGAAPLSLGCLQSECARCARKTHESVERSIECWGGSQVLVLVIASLAYDRACKSGALAFSGHAGQHASAGRAQHGRELPP